MGIVLNEDWTAYVVGEMHKYRIRNPELAAACNYHPAYLSTVLNGNKELSEEGREKTRDHILACLEKLKAEKLAEVESDGSEN